MRSQEDPEQLLALVSVLISNQVEGLQLKEKLVGECLGDVCARKSCGVL